MNNIMQITVYLKTETSLLMTSKNNPTPRVLETKKRKREEHSGGDDDDGGEDDQESSEEEFFGIEEAKEEEEGHFDNDDSDNDDEGWGDGIGWRPGPIIGLPTPAPRLQSPTLPQAPFSATTAPTQAGPQRETCCTCGSDMSVEEGVWRCMNCKWADEPDSKGAAHDDDDDDDDDSDDDDDEHLESWPQKPLRSESDSSYREPSQAVPEVTTGALFAANRPGAPAGLTDTVTANLKHCTLKLADSPAICATAKQILAEKLKVRQAEKELPRAKQILTQKLKVRQAEKELRREKEAAAAAAAAEQEQQIDEEAAAKGIILTRAKAEINRDEDWPLKKVQPPYLSQGAPAFITLMERHPTSSPTPERPLLSKECKALRSC